jgi:hypothetical protein
MTATTTRKTSRFVVQWRTASGWQTIHGYKTEAAALDQFRSLTDCGTYRVITGDPHGDFEVVGIRCPSVPDDPWAAGNRCGEDIRGTR